VVVWRGEENSSLGKEFFARGWEKVGLILRDTAVVLKNSQK